MARRRKIKSIGEMGFTLLATGGGVLLALSFLQNSPLTLMFMALRPWAWLAVALGAFLLGLHALSTRRAGDSSWKPVEPSLGSRRSTSTHTSSQPGGVLIDDDLRDRWRPPERAEAAVARPTAWTQAVFDLIEWRRFEALCEALLQQEGWFTASQAFGADGGIDIRLYNDASKLQLSGIVQCKNWSTKKISEVPIREFLGLKTDHRVGTALFITSSSFLPGAVDLAARHGIVWVNGRGLLARIQAQPFEVQQRLLAVATEGEFWRPTCVQCGTKMTLKTNSTNASRFWVCGRCSHKMPARQEVGS
jgi:restriction system protein